MKIRSVEIKELPSVKTIARTHNGPYSEIHKAFAELSAWAKKNGILNPAPLFFGVYHDDPGISSPENYRSEACIEDKGVAEPSDGMIGYTITGGKYLVVNVDTTMPEFGQAWQHAYDAMKDRGLQGDSRDHYEVYLNNPGESGDTIWNVEICLPVK